MKNKKGDIEINALVIGLLVVAAAVIIFLAIFIFKDKTLSAINYLKNLFSFK